MDVLLGLIALLISMTLSKTSVIADKGVSTRYLLEEKEVKTVRSTFTQFQLNLTTISPGGDTVYPDHTGGHTDQHTNNDNQHDGECFKGKNECETLVRQCGSRIFTMMMEDADYDPVPEESDPCRCVFHCFNHFGQGCSRLGRRISRLQARTHGHGDDQHSVFTHVGELVGAFATGSVVGIFITLLMANLIRRCTQRPMEQPREMRLLSSAGQKATLRAPMPSPIPAVEGFYTEGPIGTPSPKLSRVPSRTLYEDLDEMIVNSQRSKDSAPSTYFVLEKDIGGDRMDMEYEEDADNMPSESSRTQRTSASPDVVPEVRGDAASHDQDVQNSKL